MTNTLYLGDCLDVMKDIPDRSVDMILADLPYGTTRNKWDCTLDLEALWRHYKRVTKENAAIVLFAQVPFAQVLGASNLDMLRYEWIWMKTMATGYLNVHRMPMKAHETILVFYQKLPTYNPQKREGLKPYVRSEQGHGNSHQSSNYGQIERRVKSSAEDGRRFPIDVLSFSNPNRHTLHPTQKPVALCEYLIRTYTNPGELVLDSCMGSGTTCVAALHTGRNSIGIEINEDYFTIAQDRLKQEVAA